MRKEVALPREEGQSLILVAFAIIVLVGFVGLGVDLGLAYIERVRIQRAADAAALAAASELPLENAAGLRALEYLAENDYDCGLGSPVNVNNPCTDPTVRLEVATAPGGDSGEPTYQHVSGPADPNDASFVIRLNAKENQGSRFRVELVQNVRMYFMGLLGFGSVPVSGSAMAENIQDLDIMLAFDESGSMEFFTLCYGCWTPRDGELYPEGDRWPLPWWGPPDGPPIQCSGAGDGPYEHGGDTYIIVEAEEYSYASSDYHRATYPGKGYTYWVLSRNGEVNEPKTNHLGDTGAYGRDDRGAYISHAPRRIGGYHTDGSGVDCYWDAINNGEMCSYSQWVLDLGGPYPAPRVDYEFTVPESGNWYIWIRAQGGSSSDARRKTYWGVDGDPKGWSDDGLEQVSNGYNGADKNRWDWARLYYEGGGRGTYFNEGETYTLNIWGGGAGFALDRIIITNDDSSNNLPNQVTDENRDYIDNNRTGAACNPCDARFGGYPGGPGYNDPPNCNDPNLPESARYRYMDDIYDDEQPLASAAAASIRFIKKLDFNFDQIGLVTYSGKANRVVQLLCLKSNGQGCTKNVIDNTIIDTLNSRNQTKAGGSTNIADALEEAIEALDNESPHYGRPGAAKIIILMTDGQPNSSSNLRPEHRECESMPQLWTGQIDSSAHDCSMYFANMARDKGIIIFGITLGDGADQQLMGAIAERTGGIHRHAEEVEALDDIFDELYNRIFLRLVE
ncbi:MAG: VWA domain-containing protein [Anaerolineales bacterium]